MAFDSYVLMGQLGLAILAVILLFMLGAVGLKALWHIARGAVRLVIGLIRLPIDFLVRMLQEG